MLRVLVALGAVITLGILSRLYPIGWPPYDKSLGDVLYAAAVYLALALLLPRQRPVRVAALALAACLAIEFFQATGIPARHRDWWVVRWLVGTQLAWHDVGCYVVGVAATFAFDRWLLRPGPAKG